MTTLAHPSALRGPAKGGVAARRAVIRWAWRMFRREWRQQILVIALLSVAVAAAIGSITIAYNTTPADDADFGSANFVLELDGADPKTLQAAIAAAEERFGTTDAIGHRSVAVPGNAEPIDFRAQNPNGAYGGELLALAEGAYPTGLREVAVTDGVAELLQLEIGSTTALDGLRRTVVGIVENPRKLSDEFALVSPSSTRAPDHVTVLIEGDDESIGAFFESVGDESAAVSMMNRGNDTPAWVNTLAMFSVATVLLLLASLVAAAGFAVVAHRRLRQLGMLAAVGATQKHLRLVLLANGVVVGAIAALLGSIAGLALWLMFAPTLESAIDHRIDRLSLPWGLLVAAVLLAVVAATAAAWWPGRAAARLPIMLALSGRPPKPRPARHSAIAAAALIAVGIGSLALSNRDIPLLIVAGILATILGTLLLGPLAIRVFSRVAGRVPIAPRLALRDLARYQARSGAALAAITLALGIAATVVVIASAEEAKSASEPPNLSNRQIRVYLGPSEARELSPFLASAEVDRLAARVRQLATQLEDGAAVLTLHNALQPGTRSQVIDGTRVRFPVFLMKTVDRRGHTVESQLYVATPAVLRHLGIDSDKVGPTTDFLADPTVPTDELVILDETSGESRKELAVTNVQRIDVGQHLFGSAGNMTDKPPTFITLDGLRRHGWKQIPAGWLLESNRPLTGDQIADARELSASSGLTIEVRRERDSLGMAMAIATAAGALLALAILAMTVGLIRSESAGDLRTLTATGATSGIRRTLTAVTAGALALLGALLGIAGAYVVLAGMYYDDLGYLSDVPVFYLALAAVGVPLAAAAAGWALAGREPPAIARPVIE